MSRLELWFPGLKQTRYEVKSPKTKQYNCIAFAAGDTDNWWWPAPDDYWPEGVPRAKTIEAFKEAFRQLGYEECQSKKFVEGFEKVAIFANEGDPAHAARQVGEGQWVSKCGGGQDIKHKLEALEGDVYGSVVCIMRRENIE